MKLLLIILVALYVISPADLLPDIIPISGWLDDAFLVGVLMYFLRQGRFPVFLSWLDRFFVDRRKNRETSYQNNTGPGHEKRPENPQKDPHEILGIRRDASPQEIREAYRRAVQSYHPDKVSHLGQDLQVLAQQKFIEIQQAYHVLTDKQDAG